MACTDAVKFVRVSASTSSCTLVPSSQLSVTDVSPSAETGIIAPITSPTARASARTGRLIVRSSEIRPTLARSAVDQVAADRAPGCVLEDVFHRCHPDVNVWQKESGTRWHAEPQ